MHEDQRGEAAGRVGNNVNSLTPLYDLIMTEQSTDFYALHRVYPRDSRSTAMAVSVADPLLTGLGEPTWAGRLGLGKLLSLPKCILHSPVSFSREY